MLPTKAKEHFQRQHKADKGESIRPTLTKWVLFSFSAPFSPIPAIIYQWAKRSKSEQVPKEFAHINPVRLTINQSKVEAVRLTINHSKASLLFSPPARAKASDFGLCSIETAETVRLYLDKVDVLCMKVVCKVALVSRAETTEKRPLDKVKAK